MEIYSSCNINLTIFTLAKLVFKIPFSTYLKDVTRYGRHVIIINISQDMIWYHYYEKYPYWIFLNGANRKTHFPFDIIVFVCVAVWCFILISKCIKRNTPFCTYNIFCVKSSLGNFTKRNWINNTIYMRLCPAIIPLI